MTAPTGPSAACNRIETKQAQLVARQRALLGRSGLPAEVTADELADARNDADLVVVNDYITQLLAHKASLAV